MGRRFMPRALLAGALAALTPLLGGAHCTESCPAPKLVPVRTVPLSLTLEGPAAIESSTFSTVADLVLAAFPKRTLHVEVSRPAVVTLERSRNGAPPRQIAVVERSAAIPLLVDAAAREAAVRADYAAIVVRPRAPEDGSWTVRVTIALEIVHAWKNDRLHGNCIGLELAPAHNFRLVPLSEPPATR